MVGRRLRTSQVFYGWWMVAAIFVVLTTTSGLGFYNASVILRVAKDELGTSVTAVSGATALFFGVSGITGFAVARFMDQIDIRWYYAAGAVLGAASLTGLRWVDSTPELYVFFVVFGMAFAVAGLVPSTTVVARWFEQRRSVALSVASTGLSFGGITLTPLVVSLLDGRTLAEAGPWMGLAWLLGVLPAAWLFIRSWPSDKGLRADGGPAVDAGDDASAPGRPAASPAELAAAAPGVPFEIGRRSRFFRFMAASYALAFLAQVGGLAQLFNLVSERQSESVAASALSILAFSSVCGRLVGGVVVTRVPTITMTWLLILLQGVSLALIAVADGAWALRLSAGLFGVSVGNVLMLQPLLIAESFGLRAYSRVYSLSQLIGTVGVAGGPFLIGVVRDVADYRIAFLGAALCNVAAVGLLRLAGPISDAHALWVEPATETTT